MKDIKQKAYEKYQTFWMCSHEITMEDIEKLAEEWRAEQEELSENTTFLGFIEERGFDGCIWACYDEFMDYEYQDRGYMHYLLTEEEWKMYLNDIGDGYITYAEAALLIDKCVKEGILQEINSHIFIVRETGWYLEPEDMVAKDLMYDKEGRDILMAALNSNRKEKQDDNKIPGRIPLSQ